MEETNELGEVYNWEFVPAKLTSWDDAGKQWDSTGVNQPWDTFGNEGGWVVSTKRTLNLNTETESRLDRFTKEYLSLIDAAFNNEKVVMNDVEFLDGGLSLDEIREMAKKGTPIEYEDARPLVAGEYTYQKAIVGIRMRTYNLNTKLGFYKAKLSIDVEDIVDRGTVEVTSTDPANPTKVSYHKLYYNVPEEIMFNITEFTEPCTVEVLTKTEKEFTFMLKSTVNKDTYVTGKVSWLATGY
jgi:hypothetical protein